MERPTPSEAPAPRVDWREHGVRIVHASALDLNTQIGRAHV